VTDRVHPGDDRLIDLAAALLPPPVASETLRHLEACAACEERFRSIGREAERARLRPPARRRVSARRLAAIAASLLLVAVSAGLFLRWNSRQDLAEYWFPVDRETVVVRAGAPDAGSAIFQDAVEAYRRHDPSRAVALLRDREIPESLDPLKIMLASAYTHTGEFAKAETILEELRIETLPQPDRDRASWILYTALIGNGKTAEARTVAESLAAHPGEFTGAARRAVARSGKSDQ
jgi:hypothetical protein